jgi:thymidylate synthase (FAD)
MKAELLGHFGDDDMVVNAARVSHDKLADNYAPEQNVALIHYLAVHKHESPFFHPQIQFRITAPIFVARQWFRHEVGFSRNEVSRRYVDDAPEFFCPDDWRSRPHSTIKQGSGAPVSNADSIQATHLRVKIETICANAYHELTTELGIAPEQARMLLPQSMYTSWVETGSLMAYARLCRLRLEDHAQKEIRDLAKQVSDQIAPLFPVSWSELMQ